MTTQNNVLLNKTIYKAISDATRTIECAIEEPTDNFNLGVHAGALHVLDVLHQAGYHIIDPDGVKIEPSEGNTFSVDFFSSEYWDNVSN